MATINENAQKGMVEHLNRVLALDDPMTFQKVLLSYARRGHNLALLTEQVGVRRETLWKYETGVTTASFEVLAKILAAIGAKLVIIPDEAL